MKSFDNRIRLQKLIYILSYYGVRFNYDFTWWKHGPYSPQLTEDAYALEGGETITPLKGQESIIVEKVKKGKRMIEDSKKAEVIASYLYLKTRLPNNASDVEIIGELMTRKPYLRTYEVQQIINHWKETVRFT